MSYNPNNPNGAATGANSAPVVTATDDANLKGFAASGAGGYVRQDSNATIAKESGGNLATIATNTGNAATSANQTNGNQQAKITDGTNIANVLKSDGTAAGQNALQVATPNVTANGNITTQNLNLNSGTATAGSTVALGPLNGASTVSAVISGTYTGTLVPQVSADNSNWTTLSAGKQWYQKNNGTYQDNIVAATGIFTIAVAGFTYFRLTMSNTATGTATVYLLATPAVNQVTIGSPIPAGTFQIGNVGQGGTWNVGSSTATGSAVPANAFFIGMQNSSNNLQAVNSIGKVGDGASGDFQLASGLTVYNGSTYDRVRSATGAATGTLPTALLPATSGGLSIYSGSITTTVTAIKASAGQLYGWQIGNSNGSAVYVQIFNVTTGSVTLGTTTPTMSLYIPASGGATINLPQGIAFGTAISVACTTTRTGSTAPGNSVDLNFWYA